MRIKTIFLLLLGISIGLCVGGDNLLQDRLDELGYSEYICPNSYEGEQFTMYFNWFYESETSWGMFSDSYNFFNKPYAFNQSSRRLTSAEEGFYNFSAYYFHNVIPVIYNPTKEEKLEYLKMKVLAENVRFLFEQGFGMITADAANRSCIFLNSIRENQEECEFFTPFSYIVEFNMGYNWTCGRAISYELLKFEDLECMPNEGKPVWAEFLKWRNVRMEKYSLVLEKYARSGNIFDRLLNPSLDPKGSLVTDHTSNLNHQILPGYSIDQTVKEIFEALQNNDKQITAERETIEVNFPDNIADYLRNNSAFIPLGLNRIKKVWSYFGVTKVDYQPVPYGKEGGWFDPEIVAEAAGKCSSVEAGFCYLGSPDYMGTNLAYTTSALIARAFNTSFRQERYIGYFRLSEANSTDPKEIEKFIADSFDLVTSRLQNIKHTEVSSGSTYWDALNYDGDEENPKDEKAALIAVKPKLLFPNGMCKHAYV